MAQGRHRLRRSRRAAPVERPAAAPPGWRRRQSGRRGRPTEQASHQWRRTSEQRRERLARCRRTWSDRQCSDKGSKQRRTGISGVGTALSDQQRQQRFSAGGVVPLANRTAASLSSGSRCPAATTSDVEFWHLRPAHQTVPALPLAWLPGWGGHGVQGHGGPKPGGVQQRRAARRRWQRHRVGLAVNVDRWRPWHRRRLRWRLA